MFDFPPRTRGSTEHSWPTACLQAGWHLNQTQPPPWGDGASPSFLLSGGCSYIYFIFNTLDGRWCYPKITLIWREVENVHELLLEFGSLGQDDLPTMSLLMALGRVDINHGADGV